MSALVFLLIVAFALGYAMGRLRSRDRLPIEVFDKDGRRVQ